jgi:type IV pilus assembly protein PilQ
MMIMTAVLLPLWEALAATPEGTAATSAGYLEDVTFERMPGKERVTLSVTKLSGVTVENQPGNAVLVRMENLFVPEGLRRPLSDAALANIVSVTPIQKAADGRAWVLAQIDLKQKVPYSVRQEGMNVLIDFNVASLPQGAEPATGKAAPKAAPAPAAATAQPKAPVAAARMAAAPKTAETAKPAAVKPGKKVNTSSRIFLDVQDADIKSVFRLLAEQGNVSIVSGDDVKGTVTLLMKDVPWEQAFSTILDLKGLDQKREGDIITVITLDRKKKDEADRIATQMALQKAEDERKVREQKQNVEQGKLRQIAIEAKIVEVTTNFSRELGIRWGYGYKDTWNGRDIGGLIGTSPTGALTTLPSGLGLTSSNAAVNFPAVSGIATPGIGIVAGSAQFVLDAKLSALDTSGNGKIVSSPKVTTLENEKATIWQGKRLPVVTPATSTGPATVRYEDADLRLVVTPKITPKVALVDEDRISMDIEASNKDIDESIKVEGNPAINSNGVTSKVVVKDGDTIVVGGIYKTTETFTKDGVPFFSEIPFLGWLFKYETKSKDTREILIFITPRIIRNTQ